MPSKPPNPRDQSLRKLLEKKGRLPAILSSLMQNLDGKVWIQDRNGNLLLGSDPAPQGRAYPILLNGVEIGCTLGGRAAASLGELLSHLLQEETEKKSLAAEVLERYRELSLLHNLANKLSAAPQPEAIPQVALDEITRLIHATAGVIILRSSKADDGYLPVASTGANQLAPSDWAPGSLVERVLLSGKGDISNHGPAGETNGSAAGACLALIAAPLKTEKRTLGAILLAEAGTNPFTASDLKLLSTIAQQVAPAIEITHLYQVAIEKARMEHELEMAVQVQVGLLPRAMPEIPGWEFHALWRPARGVSGDFYDLIPEKDGQLGLVIADVTDKSLPAALFMAFTRSVLRATINRNTSPAEGMTRSNQLICTESNQSLFVTLVYTRLNLNTGSAVFVNAGHNPPLLFRTRQAGVDSLQRTGIPLGIEEDSTYEQRSVHLHPGDFIFFYTDGVTEAFNSRDEQFGEERLQEVLLAHRDHAAAEVIKAVENAIDAFTGSGEPSDDITMLITKRLEDSK